MLGITMGAVIGTEVGKEPEPCIIGDIADIQAKVGNNHSYGATIHTEYAVDYGADIRIERLKESYSTMMQNPVEWVVSTIKGMELI